MKTILIAAKAQNGVIGNLNELPWNLPSDLEHFKRTTMGNIMLMGSRTWESFGCRALPGRQHVVVSSRHLTIREKDMDRVHHASSVQAGLDIGSYIAQAQDCDLYVIGGANVYEQTIGKVDELVITEIERSFVGDRYFPQIDPEIWRASMIVVDDTNSLPYRITTYVRRA